MNRVTRHLLLMSITAPLFCGALVGCAAIAPALLSSVGQLPIESEESPSHPDTSSTVGHKLELRRADYVKPSSSKLATTKQASEEVVTPPAKEEIPPAADDQRQSTNGISEVPLLPPSAPSSEQNAFDQAGNTTRAIDLPTALHLADARNPLVAYTREQVCQAYARLEKANVLWLPSIRAGVAFNHHDGSIQQIDGPQLNTSRNDFYSGLGASPYGIGSPIVPGVWASFQLADAIFQPLAAQQQVGARRAAAGATLNDALLQVAQIYLELLRAKQDLAIAQETEQHAQALDDVTRKYAEAGEGLQSDADRAATELSLRKNNVVRAEESIAVTAARLAQLLHLNPVLQFDPIEPVVTPLDLTPEDSADSLIAQALSARPELAEARHLVCEAINRWKREKYAPFVPSVMLGVSDGGMTAGKNTDYAAGQNRFDMDAVAFWELRNFGFGDQAAQRDARSVVDQTRWRQVEVMDRVAREVTEANIQVRARREQIKIAEEGVRVAVHSYKLNIDRIEQAKGLPIEALQSLQALDQARREYLRSVIDYNVAQFTLLRALGWPDYGSS
jgi:outer membrane protein TolC